MTGTWLPHIILNTLIFYATLLGFMAHRLSMGDDINMFLSFVITAVAFSMLETALYTSIRSKAQLFIKLKVIQLQEE